MTTTKPTVDEIKGIYLWSKNKKIEIKNDGKILIDGSEDVKDDKKNDLNADLSMTDTICMFADNTKRAFYSKSILSKQYENLIILSGAGTSIGCGKTEIKGKSVNDLYTIVKEIFGSGFNSFCDKCNYIENGENNLEALMSAANIAKNFNKTEAERQEVKEGINTIEAIITKECAIELDEVNDPHKLFIDKIIKRKLKYPRSKIFTVNYDTLFEQACSVSRCYIIDGFSYSNPRIFNGRNFDYDFVIRENSRIKDEENFIPKVLQLYKMHGSLGWDINENIIQSGDLSKSVMIFPRESKYEQSYEQPFFEMMSRFQLELRRSDVLLICIGFSFNDKHIVTVIKEALRQNPGFQLLIVDPNIESNNFEFFRISSEKDSRVTLIRESFKDFVIHYPENKSITQDERLRSLYDN